MSTELELNDSAPPFIVDLKEKGIKAVLFDIDNTLLETGIYFFETWGSSSLIVAKYLGIDGEKEKDDFKKEFLSKLFQGYLDRDKKPIDIYEEIILVIDDIFKDKEKEISYHLLDEIYSYVSNFYNISPILSEGSIDVLKGLLSSETLFALCSHAQGQWTSCKARYIGNAVERNEIIYHSVPIDLDKDSDSWLVTAGLLSVSVEETLIVGDNWDADILSGIEAGCRCLVWIDREGKGLPDDYDIPHGVSIKVVRSIGQLKQ